MSSLNDEKILNMKEEAAIEVKAVVQKIEKDYPGVTEGLSTAIGSTAGAGGSFVALYLLGTTGLSAAGITSGLATAGALIGGGMVAGIGVLAAPIAILGIVGYAIAKKRKSAKLAAALGQAIAKLYEIQERLLLNAEYFKEELAIIKATVEFLKTRKPA